MVAIHGYGSDGTSGSDSGDDTRTTTPNNNNPPSSSWRGWKERGKQAYLKGDYASALQNYSQALHRQNNIVNNVQAGNNNNNNNIHNIPSKLDRQVLLSNMVACRLKLGGAPQAEAAVSNAQKCISIDNQWAKGYMRLAEAYIALKRSMNSEAEQQQQQKRMEYSNKACDALQRVIDLDPTNQTAHDMLTKELRYWNLHGNRETTSTTTSSNSAGSATSEPSAPPEHMDEARNSQEQHSSESSAPPEHMDDNRNQTATSEPQQQQQHQDSDNHTDNIDIEDDSNYVFTPSWQDRLVFKIQNVRTWYAGLCEDDKALVKMAISFVVLYVAFGGRFGLEYLGKNNNSSSRRSSSAYDEFYQSRNSNSRRYDTNYDRYGRSYDTNYDRYGRSTSSYGRRSNSWSSYGSGSGSYGHYPYMLIVLGASYIAQRYFGVGPYEAMLFVNLLLGRRNRGFMPRRGYGWGNGMHFGARPRYHHRPGGMWGF